MSLREDDRNGLPAAADEPVQPSTHDHTISEFGTPPEIVVDDEEKPGRVLTGIPAILVTIGAISSGLFALWQLFRPLAQGSQYYLILFLATVLPLIFLCYSIEFRLPGRAKPIGADRVDGRPRAWDWVLALLALVTCLYPVLPISFGADEGGGYNAFLDRQGLLAPADVVMGGILLLLVLEACRRTTGWILPAVCLLFLAYGYYGGYIPQTWDIAHAGMDMSEIIDGLYNSGSGFYGTPLDVAATYIVLFTIYGGVLQLAGAGKFFVDLSVAAFRGSRSAPGRTAVSAGFLLGTVSGSGAATTVSIGAVTWPILKKAGYPAERAGGMLAAAGVGAILSPPTLGAAAFIIAEYLGVSYLKVLGWATIPTVLYYLGILLAVEIDARRSGTRAVELDTPSPLRLLARFGYHFLSLFIIIGLLAYGFTATRAVVYATLFALAGWVIEGLVRFSRGDDRNVGRAALSAVRQVLMSLAEGVRSVLPVVAVCAAAGIIAVNTTKTGLGPQAANLLIKGGQALADDPTLVRLFTALFAAIALTLLGLAVPVTASFIIGWVIIGPALLDLGASEAAVAMFVFYFAVLSEATPPTALASVAAAAVTGGRIVPTMWQTLRYALPAYAVPIAFVAAPAGNGLLGLGPAGEIVYALLASAVSVAALAVATGGWIPGIGRAGTPERIVAAVAGVLLLWLSPVSTAVGVGVALLATFLVFVRRRRGVATPEGELS
ncbi:C4-dicarboxylate ABC transporter permease [Virgisporangium aliadipatigenens]|uniref:C4-dicarboxylate ABC transporter permease n=1 Tax=Virgisporangium aliadipatigenens TaxID=741659 RepID=A0A8J4DR12_9ACTN|nr:TRAP transporter fused permease subunit [Virgisporangium aliadipatigenens]GIJ46303.1 C4-dicarboxylate ABC transporter permease [Virgisporangium aliadipatigenens]